LGQSDVEKMLTSISDTGRWGPKDELGTVNLITPEKRREAAALVQDGVSVSLAHDAVPGENAGTKSFEHKMTSTGVSPDSTHSSDIYSFDYHGSVLTHLDALCHIFYHGKMYNDYPQSEVTENGAARLSVINMKNGLFTRAVLMDMPALWGVKYLPAGKAIYPADLEAWEKKSGAKLEQGDAILLNTGRWLRQQKEGVAVVEKAAPGLHVSCLPWFKQRGVAIVGSDFATDLIPSGIPGVETPIHLGVITALGTPILDNCDFQKASEYARAHRHWAFLLTAAPLAVPGGTGSPINPVATF
jgi:kynurenine formamidase